MKHLILMVLTCLWLQLEVRSLQEDGLFAVEWIVRLSVDDMDVAKKLADENNFVVVERSSEKFFVLKPREGVKDSKEMASNERKLRKNPLVKSVEKVRYPKWAASNRLLPFAEIGSADERWAFLFTTHSFVISLCIFVFTWKNDNFNNDIFFRKLFTMYLFFSYLFICNYTNLNRTRIKNKKIIIILLKIVVFFLFLIIIINDIVSMYRFDANKNSQINENHETRNETV